MDNPESSTERINIHREANESDVTGWTPSVSIDSIFVNLNQGENKMMFDDTFAIMDVYGGDDKDGESLLSLIISEKRKKRE